MKGFVTHVAAAVVGALAAIFAVLGWDAWDRKRRGY